MQEVNISDLKAHLSAKIQRVKRGEKMIIMDRNTPVAFLTPYVKKNEKSLEDLIMIPATNHNHEELKHMVISKVKKKFDPLKTLREDRDTR